MILRNTAAFTLAMLTLVGIADAKKITFVIKGISARVTIAALTEAEAMTASDHCDLDMILMDKATTTEKIGVSEAEDGFGEALERAQVFSETEYLNNRKAFCLDAFQHNPLINEFQSSEKWSGKSK